VDEGISGWKIGHERPSYDRLLQDAESKSNFSAIFVDNLDRLSRATPFKVAADLNRPAEAGVADIFCANGDCYHIQDEYNYGEVFRIVAEIGRAHV
jgi:acetylglutamate synthase